MSGDVDMAGAARILNRSYSWFQRSWRRLEGFPPPFTGAEPHGRPQWRAVDVEAYKAGRRWRPAEAAPLVAAAPPHPANDPTPAPPADRVRALLAFG